MVASQKMGQQWAQQIGSSQNWKLLNYVGLGSSTEIRIGLGQLLKKTPDLWVRVHVYTPFPDLDSDVQHFSGQ